MKDGSQKRFAISLKMYIFIVSMILFVVIAVSALAYVINVSQLDGYFKRLTSNSAKNVAALMDVEFLKELRTLAESEEYQALREQAEAEDDDTLVIAYFQEKGVWEKYQEERNKLVTYVQNMEDVKYLYAIAWGDAEAKYDMYLLDADDVPFYETGYYEEREAEFEGTDPTKDIAPVISKGDWGWLCSGYATVRDENGEIVCHVGCDVGMEDVMKARMQNLIYMSISAIACTIIALAGAFLFINRTVVWPLNALTKEMKKFSPSEKGDYKEAGVINVEVKSRDEIRDIYDEIHSMQVRIVDYIKNITVIQREKEKAEDEARSKEEMIGKISKDAYKDALTGIGNKASYVTKINELNEEIKSGKTEFAVVMIDVNCLKIINDNYGHSAGDTYLKGVCRVICNVFKHSPVYRIGGDEFVAILTGEDFDNRHDKVKELRTSFDQSYHRDDVEPWLRYSASVGMAEYASEDATVELVFRRADKYMYEEKMKFKQQNGIAQGAR